jgi:large exoprotein involved in heme utilization and adhesion
VITTNSAGALGSEGQAGQVELNTAQLSITGGSTVRSQTTGNGSGGTITAQGIDGAAQSILITGAGSGILTDGTSFIEDGKVVGTGTGGNISLIANSVTIQNGATVSASTSGLGNAGNILVKADSVSITSGGQFTSSSTIRQARIEGEELPPPTGNAGTVTIKGLASAAESVLIDGAGSGVFTNTQNTGAGGNIFVNANSVTVQNGANVSSSSTGPGNTGNINITAGNQFAMTNSTVTTEATQSGGGLIKITTNPNGTVQLTNSMISASVLDGNGGGGSVNIDPQFVILQNSQILANSVFGPGGNINITTNLLLPDPTSVISASSQFGQQGTVTIQSPASPASGKIVPLGQKPLIAMSLLSQRCAALAGGTASSFTIAGRDSLPAEPGGWLPSPLALAVAESEDGSAREASLATTPNVAAEDIRLLSLKKIAPSGFLTQTFAANSTEGCKS